MGLRENVWLSVRSLLVVGFQWQEEVIQDVVGDRHAHGSAHIARVAVVDAGPNPRLLYLGGGIAEAVERREQRSTHTEKKCSVSACGRGEGWLEMWTTSPNETLVLSYAINWRCGEEGKHACAVV